MTEEQGTRSKERLMSPKSDDRRAKSGELKVRRLKTKAERPRSKSFSVILRDA